MALKILKADEPLLIEKLTVTIYGQPGLGKTSLAFTADSPLLIDFDKGAHRALERKDIVPVSLWTDVTDITRDDMEPFRTIIVDTAGRALDALAVDIMRREPKMGRGGALTQQGWGRLKAEFTGWLNMLHSFGKDVVLIAHGTERQDGDDLIVRLDVQGGSKDEIYKSSDVMGVLKVAGGRRIIQLDPTDTAYGKNPGGLAPLEFKKNDSDLMARIITDTKTAINSKSEESRQEYDRITRLRDDLFTIDTLDEFNSMIESMKDSSPKDKGILVEIAGKKGFLIDKKTKQFVGAEAA